MLEALKSCRQVGRALSTAQYKPEVQIRVVHALWHSCVSVDFGKDDDQVRTARSLPLPQRAKLEMIVAHELYALKTIAQSGTEVHLSPDTGDAYV